jgi:membrane-associated phospholipid phosphatase
MMLQASGIFRYLAQIRQNRAFAFMVVLFLSFLALSIAAHSPALLQWDQRVTRAFQKLRSEPLDRMVRAVTLLADPLPLIALGVIGTIAWWMAARPWAGVLVGISVLGMPLNFGIKQLIRRPRPEEGLVKVLLPVIGRSFPSGHAMTAVLFYGFLAFLVWIHVQHPGWRLFWASTLVVIAITVGLSRVYLGVHWFSDVIGGWTAGLFFLLILALIYRAVAGNELAVKP